MTSRLHAAGIPRSIAEYAEDVARRRQGEVIRILDLRAAAGAVSAAPGALFSPVVPVEFIGPYTHEFTTTALLSGLFLTNSSGAAMSAGGELLVTATGSSSPAWVYPGRDRGAFLPHDGPWSVEIHVTECCGSGRRAGLGITPGDMAAGIQWGGASGRAYCYFYDQAGTPRVFGGASTYDSAVLSQFPSGESPVCLKIEQSFPGGVRTLKFHYREGLAGDWTIFKTDTPGSGYWTQDLDLGPIAGLIGSTGDYGAAFDMMSVDYVPETSPGIFAFIPTASFGGRQKDHVYILDASGAYVDIPPEPWGAVVA
ncbi:MAG: hypothetical protein JW909_13110, partial [Planctomycetes bacterium]|nr:hypothetical protein [Planctomycetota bacterium]